LNIGGEDIWKERLIRVEEYIDKEGKRPSAVDKNKEIS